jgi:hypothetical protein
MASLTRAVEEKNRKDDDLTQTVARLVMQVELSNRRR